jgi:hypothetical protein
MDKLPESIRELRPHAAWDLIKEAFKLMLPFLAGLGIREWVNNHTTAVMWLAAFVVCAGVVFFDRLIPTSHPIRKPFTESWLLIGNSAVLEDYADQADALSGMLEGIWHHWDRAGKKLTHPLTADLGNQITGWSQQELNLTHELLDFRALYGQHLALVRLRFQEFSSTAIIDGYPSGDEYVAVKMNISNHAAFLREYARQLRASIVMQQA